jgi:FxsC-like protein
MGNSGWEHTDDQPYFFLSYAHTPRHEQGEQADPDYWVGQLFRDLSRHMREMLGLPLGATPGFMDRELRPGNEWPSALASALATCKVFVPLYSRRYFASVHCGKEWSAFTRRVARYPGAGDEPARSIVPALWVSVRGPFPPAVARYEAARFGDTYTDLGFYGIMKLTRYRDDYEAAVYRLARQIVESGRGAPLPPGPVEPYDQLENAFGASPAGDGQRRVLVAIAAPGAAQGSRSQSGKSVREWNPYPQESKRPLAVDAADLATSLGYLPEVGSIAEHARELSQAEPTRAMVLIVDPRAAAVPQTRDILRQVDAARPWVSVLVIWNPKGHNEEGRLLRGAEESELMEALESVLPHKLVEGRATSVLAIRGVPTLADFGAVLPTVLRAAERSFLRFAPLTGEPPATRERGLPVKRDG